MIYGDTPADFADPKLTISSVRGWMAESALVVAITFFIFTGDIAAINPARQHIRVFAFSLFVDAPLETRYGQRRFNPLTMRRCQFGHGTWRSSQKVIAAITQAGRPDVYTL